VVIPLQLSKRCPDLTFGVDILPLVLADQTVDWGLFSRFVLVSTRNTNVVRYLWSPIETIDLLAMGEANEKTRMVQVYRKHLTFASDIVWGRDTLNSRRRGFSRFFTSNCRLKPRLQASKLELPAVQNLVDYYTFASDIWHRVPASSTSCVFIHCNIYLRIAGVLKFKQYRSTLKDLTLPGTGVCSGSGSKVLMVLRPRG
jgi:hypothetical protein